jgi:phosphoglucosamine mutase
LTSLKIAENLLADRVGFYKSLSEISVYPQITKNIKVKDKQKVVSQKGVVEAIALAQTFLGKCGRILVRPSGTEPVVRVMAEAKERADCFTAIDLVEEEILKADNLCVE